MLHPKNNEACVRYYFLPARKGKSAEIIKVLNSKCHTVEVPVWEEDILLEPFHTRPMTPKEILTFKGAETWKLFVSWEKLYVDHQKYGVDENELRLFENYKNKLLLSDKVLA